MSAEYKMGKGLLNSLTMGMYSNALFIYREYIQNAADAIDDAVRKGLKTPEDGYQIHVNIDQASRTITIEDNATGIPRAQVEASLGNVGASEKDPFTNKGFRGIGRLGGLAYCRKLILETSYAGENVKTISVWDADKFQALLRDRKIKDDASEVLRKTVEFSVEPCKKDIHYFRVTLVDVKQNQKNLLAYAVVYSYLRMVAPIPFDYSRFPFCKVIEKFVEERKLPKMAEYEVFLNKLRLTKGYETTMKLAGSGEKTVTIQDVKMGLLGDSDNPKGWYWYGVTDFSGTMKQCWQSRLRLRKENIQIGEANCLGREQLWSEPRFLDYFFGEVHALDRDLIPNGRRDYFEEETHCEEFEKLLVGLFESLTDVAYAASNIRTSVKAVVQTHTQITDLQKRVRGGEFDSDSAKEEAVQKINKLCGQYEALKKKLEKDKAKIQEKKDDKIVGEVLESIVDRVQYDDGPIKPIRPATTSKVALATDKLSPQQRKILDTVKSILEDKLPPEELDVIWREVLAKIKNMR